MSDDALLAASKIALWRSDPVQMVRDLFGVEPDRWQASVLRKFPTKPRIAMKACKGPGKTCVLAWIAWNFMLCYKNPKVAATSITADNLSDGLWTELAKWQSMSPLLKEQFTWRKERVTYNDEPETWWISARTWPKTGDTNAQADTLAGLHADNILFLIDEAGGIPVAVLVTAEAGLANAKPGSGKTARIVMAGNPTTLEGALYYATVTTAHMWDVTEITADPLAPDRTPRVSVEWAQDMIDVYGGRDHPWVMVNVLGKFPPNSLNTLIGPDEVRAAMARHVHLSVYEGMPVILGVDVAREGDDKSVIFPRQGRVAFKPDAYRNINSIQGAARVTLKWKEMKADGCFVDNTGGFGGGWIDQLTELGRTPIPIHFAGEPLDRRFVNKRAEMIWAMIEWVKAGGCLPDVPELIGELTTATYFFKGDKIQLESKEQIKKRLGRSPDYADALALTFAYPVEKQRSEEERIVEGWQQNDGEYDSTSRWLKDE